MPRHVQFIDVSQIERYIYFKENDRFDYCPKWHDGDLSEMLADAFKGFKAIKATLKKYEAFYHLSIPTIAKLQQDMKLEEKAKPFISKRGLFAERTEKILEQDVANPALEMPENKR